MGHWAYTNPLFLRFFVLFCFDVDHSLDSLLNLLQYFFGFRFWLFGHQECGILVSRPGIEPAPTALESKVLNTGPPGKSLHQSS